MTPDEIDRLARVAATLRPSWPLASLRTWLTGFVERNPHRTYRDTMLALVLCALDPKTEKPARLEQAGPWWTDPRQEVESQVFSGPTAVVCQKCRGLIVPGVDHECRERPVGLSAAARAELDATRRLIAATRTVAAKEAQRGIPILPDGVTASTEPTREDTE